ncbi:MAG: SGNH/GDSL hydrolase family protein [Xanthomonadales bacterium]|nr:SGNH/GDSL hydrolase family protein [Xanthomonadales bacterium]
MSLLLLGDSSAAGVGAESAQQSLLGQLQILLSDSYEVSYNLLAKTGHTTVQMLQELEDEHPHKTDVVITALGVNDVTSQVPLKQWIKQQKNLIATIRTLYQPKKIILSGLPPMRDFPALPWPLDVFLGHSADQFDAALQQICKPLSGVVFQSLKNFPSKIPAARDGFHPSPAVYQLWAQKLAFEILTTDKQCYTSEQNHSA